jgi:hypothetical protein
MGVVSTRPHSSLIELIRLAAGQRNQRDVQSLPASK